MIFQEGDLVWQPGREESRGRIIEVRDYGYQIWVARLSGRGAYYTFVDQLEHFTILDMMVSALERVR